jgi:hypothetical protein
MKLLRCLLPDPFRAMSRRGRDPWATTPAVDGLGEVRTMEGLVPALRAAVEVSRGGNGAIVLSPEPSEDIAHRVLRIEASAESNGEHPDES